MILSVIIVNFNVKYFLEQCLYSVKKAVSGTALLTGNTEVFIVDNASSDGSLAFLKPLFPEFHFIANSENKGFSRANNQALPGCSGKYVLFLNPDTLLSEDSLDQCISFFEKTPGAGALGVRMIDGCGRFLKESKRGFPTASASFFKMSGLSSFFPSSRRFAAYYAGHLNPMQDQAVDILSGAFMMVRKEVLEITGGFDEQFFMYAEDIDLSYRILKAGFRNYYLASTSIIHFKGESTRRDIRYVRQFYLAMKQFMQKHFQQSNGIMLLFLKFGITVRERVAGASLGFPKSNPVSAKFRGPVVIKGSAEELPLILGALQASDLAVTASEADAEACLFCEGAQKSFGSIIREMDNAGRKISCFIHGAGTHAAVGGSNGAAQGATIVF